MFRASTLLQLVASLSLVSACADPLASRVTSLASVDTGPSCGVISAAGCCAGATLYYCAGGTLNSKLCTPPAKCGWSAAYGLYICGSSSSSDPSGKHPRTCATTDASADAPQDVAPVVPDKAAADLPAGDKATSDAGASPDAAGGCGPLSFAGCCVKQKLYFCAGGKVLALDCQSNLHCGWNAKGGYNDCGTDGKSDPSGKHPRSCSAILGDSGLALDAGVADQGTDLAPGDSAAEDVTAADGQGDLLAVDHSGVAADGPAVDLSADHNTEGVVGLDSVGLEPSRQDASTGESDENGCNCSLSGGPGAGPVMIFLLLLCLGGRRRRQ